MGVPVLWITGPGGVGKSTASWQLFTGLAGAGVPVAFADTDQFCMCYPAPPGDPARERLKARNVGVFVAQAQAAGARCVIANGVVDPDLGLLHDLMPSAEVTSCRLRADETEIVSRLRSRQAADAGEVDQVLADTLDEARALDVSTFADACVDTTGVAADEVVGLIRRACPDWAGFREPVPAGGPPPREPGAPAAPGGRVLLLCGPTGVGKSTIGFEVYLRWLRAGLTAGYLDLGQLGFIRPAPPGDPGRHRLKAGNLAGMWQTYREAGATHLIATGPVGSEAELRSYASAVPTASVTAGRLHAGPAELRRRIFARGEGGGWSEPGDPLRGQPASYLRQVADKAVAEAAALDGASLDAVRIDTDGLSASEAAGLIDSRITNTSG